MVSQGGRSENRQQEIAEISRGLKILARDLDVPVLAIAQLSRAVEQRHDKRPLLSDLRDSGALEQDADMVMFLYRDEYYNPDSDDKGIAEIIVGSTATDPQARSSSPGWSSTPSSPPSPEESNQSSSKTSHLRVVYALAFVGLPSSAPLLQNLQNRYS